MSAEVVRLAAPAKLTVSLRVTGLGSSGLHELDAEMVTLDLADELVLRPGGQGLSARTPEGGPAAGVPLGPGNLVARALAACGRTAAVELVKRIPVGGGLGGGSADAAAVLRWAGVHDPSVAAGLGSDVPFCVVGGRARVTGTGERVDPLDFQRRSFVLLLPPFGVDTGAVYRAWDRLQDAGGATGGPDGVNDLQDAALAVEPRLAAWRDALETLADRPAVLAGSGSTWFVEGSLEELDLGPRPVATVGEERSILLGVATVPAGWAGPA